MVGGQSINLRKSYAYTPEDFLDTFSPRTRSFIRSVTAKAYTWVTVTPDECATFAQIILALPNVEAMPVIISDVYQQGSPGVAMYEELAATVYGKLSSLDFTIVEAEKVGWREKRQVPPNLDLSAARTIFAYLDPTRLRRLALVGEISMPAMFSDILCQFVRLEQFSLRAARLDLAPFFAALATIPARLRSLEVQVVLGPVAQASALLPMLAAFGPSLEHLTLSSKLREDLADSVIFDMPLLRHLALHVNSPIEFAARFRSAARDPRPRNTILRGFRRIERLAARPDVVAAGYT